MDMQCSPVGVFDSGVGGLAVLKDLMLALPGEDFVYYGDNANAPYGVLPQRRIQELTFACVDRLMDMDVKCIVIACNTASSAAVQAVRDAYRLPIVAMEPAVRPAAHALKSGKALVMATEATLHQALYNERVKECGITDRMIPLPCPKLVELVELGVTRGDAVEEAVLGYFEPYVKKSIDAVVLGCTHFLHMKESIAEIAKTLWPQAVVIDGNEGTARQLIRVLDENGLQNPREAGGTARYLTSGDPKKYLPVFDKLMK